MSVVSESSVDTKGVLDDIIPRMEEGVLDDIIPRMKRNEGMLGPGKGKRRRHKKGRLQTDVPEWQQADVPFPFF